MAGYEMIQKLRQFRTVGRIHICHMGITTTLCGKSFMPFAKDTCRQEDIDYYVRCGGSLCGKCRAILVKEVQS